MKATLVEQASLDMRDKALAPWKTRYKNNAHDRGGWQGISHRFAIVLPLFYERVRTSFQKSDCNHSD